MSSSDNSNPGSEHGEDDDTVYEVESILNHRVKDGINQYLLKWKNYPESEATWENEENLNCKDLLEEYIAKRDSIYEQKRKEKVEQNYVNDPYSIKVKEPEIIIASFKKDDLLYYRVLCKNPPIYYSMPASELRKVRPDLICNFLENKIVFNEK